jgi:hypothetical protein
MHRCVCLLAFGSLVFTACNREPHEAEHHGSIKSEPGLAPRAQPSEPEATPEQTPAPEVEPAPEPTPEPEPDPVMAERKQALADVGRRAFEALQNDDFEALLQLTPLVDGYLREVCPKVTVGSRDELQARFAHCRKSIAWDKVAEAQAFAAQPTGERAAGCNEGIEDYGRLQLYLHMQDKSIWRVEFYGAIGRDGNPIGIGGEVSCKPDTDAPKLK